MHARNRTAMLSIQLHKSQPTTTTTTTTATTTAAATSTMIGISEWKLEKNDWHRLDSKQRSNIWTKRQFFLHHPKLHILELETMGGISDDETLRSSFVCCHAYERKATRLCPNWQILLTDKFPTAERYLPYLTPDLIYTRWGSNLNLRSGPTQTDVMWPPKNCMSET